MLYLFKRGRTLLLPIRRQSLQDLRHRRRLTLRGSSFQNDKADRIDITIAIKVLNRLGKYNFSQGVVVRNKKVIAIEGKGGTQKMLKNCKSRKFRNKGVLVKFPKKKQDHRIDLPTVGLKTLKQCKSAGLKGIVLKNKKNIFLERNKCFNFANSNKMFVVAK